jgi:hypothetical protein
MFLLIAAGLFGILPFLWLGIIAKPSPGPRYVPTAANIANYNRVRANCRCKRCVNPRTGRRSIAPM